MKLQSKITVLLATVFVLYISVDFAIQRYIMYPSFVALERDEATKDLERCREAIDREREHLSLLCFDWSAWTDTYKYVRGEMPEYYESNIANLDWFTDIDMNVMYFVTTAGEVIFGLSMDTETHEPMPLAGFPMDRWPADHALLALEPTGDSSVEGIMMTEHGPLMVVSRPILTSEYEGPMAGALVMGRFMDDEAVAGLVERTRVDFRLWPIGGGAVSETDRAAIAQIGSAGDVLVEERSEDLLSAFAVVEDIEGTPALALRADVPRDITARGQGALTFATYSLVAAGVLIAGVLLVALRRIVVHPVVRLTAHATRIGTSSDLTTRIGMSRDDELGMLADEFDGMVGKLSESRTKLVDVSRQAGMAEIASGVLHNVGNVLSNVNVLTNSLATRAGQSKVEGLRKAVDLLEEHRDDLGTFFTEDERGRQLVPYLADLAEHLTGEIRKTVDDLGVLRENIQHMNQVVDAQQALASPAEVQEPTSLSELAEGALAVVDASFCRHGIKVVREWEDVPTVMIDRGKVLQVLINLLTNAKEAMGEVEEDKRQLTLRIQCADGRVRFEVIDSGAGIASDRLTRIFAEGFTTKEGGHGFGLHYSALAAKEMGGSLAARSDGPGSGATFELDLPVEPMARSEAA